MAALGVLRAWAERRRAAAADAGAGRLGRRGGRALRPQPVRQLGVRRHASTRPSSPSCATPRAARSPRCWPRTGSSSSARGECAPRRERPRRLPRAPHRAGAACWRREGLRAAAVTGCAGVERLRFALLGPGLARRDDADGRPPRRRPRRRRGGARDRADPATPTAASATTGELRLEPGIPTAVAGRATLAVDLRHPEAAALARMLDGARAACRRGGRRPRLRARARRRSGGSSRSPSTPGSSPPPASACARGRRRARRACQRRAARRRRGRPGAAGGDALRALARRDQPRPEEDTAEADLAVAIEAFGALAAQRCSQQAA